MSREAGGKVDAAEQDGGGAVKARSEASAGLERQNARSTPLRPSQRLRLKQRFRKRPTEPLRGKSACPLTPQ